MYHRALFANWSAGGMFFFFLVKPTTERQLQEKPHPVFDLGEAPEHGPSGGNPDITLPPFQLCSTTSIKSYRDQSKAAS